MAMPVEHLPRTGEDMSGSVCFGEAHLSLRGRHRFGGWGRLGEGLGSDAGLSAP